MVALSQRVIAVYDGRNRGGTHFTLQYACLQNREVRVIPL